MTLILSWISHSSSDSCRNSSRFENCQNYDVQLLKFGAGIHVIKITPSCARKMFISFLCRDRHVLINLEEKYLLNV